jgi:uncharacterized membrane protein
MCSFMKLFLFSTTVVILLGLCMSVSVTTGASVSPEATPTFAEVAVILEENCTMCHSGPKAPKGLQLASYESVMKGSVDGPVVIAGGPKESELVRRIRGISMPRMPLSGPPYLSEEEMNLIEAWINAGAANIHQEDQVILLGTTEAQHKAETGFVTYDNVSPIFKMHCIKCHAHKGLMGPPPEGLVLTSLEGILDVRDRARVVPGNSAASELVRKVRGQSLPRMPFDGPPYLSDGEIQLIELWVADGARDGQGVRSPVPVGARVRLGGRLIASDVLDDLPLHSAGRRSVRHRSSVGDYVEVRGTVLDNGAIGVERIRRR